LPDTQGIKPYNTIAGAGESEIVISKSRFLGYCIPVSSETEAQACIAGIRKKHWDARHVCYAFCIADGPTRSTDDGEPSGTAGAPILNVLAQNEIQNALCAVVRYFGGVLLGTGGLVRAYGKAASNALSAAVPVRMEVCARLDVTLSYAAYASLEPVFRALHYPAEAEFAENVKLKCTLPLERQESFVKIITDRTGGNAEIAAKAQLLCPVKIPAGREGDTHGKQGANGS